MAISLDSESSDLGLSSVHGPDLFVLFKQCTCTLTIKCLQSLHPSVLYSLFYLWVLVNLLLHVDGDNPTTFIWKEVEVHMYP